MAGIVKLGEQSISVSNNVLVSLVEFALDVGERLAHDRDARAWVEKLREVRGTMRPGIELDLEALFADVEQKKFWALVFHEVARRIFLREIGNQTVTFWQTGCIANSFVIARSLVQSVRKHEPKWAPATSDAREAEEFWVRGTVKP